MTINLKPYFKLLRLKDARSYFLIALFGFIISQGFLFPFEDIIIFSGIILLFLGFGFSINDCFDVKEDELDKTKKNPIVSKETSFKKGLVFSISLAILGLALSSFFGLKVFLFCLAGILLVFFYSSPPLRMKSKVLLDLISHGLFAGPFIFFLPLLIFETKLTLFHYLIVFSLFCLSIILELRNHLEDYETDKAVGLKTTVLAFGYKKSEKLLKALAILYPLTLLPIFNLISQKYLFLFLILTLIFLIFFFFGKNYRLVKNYKTMDGYVVLSFGLILIAIF